MKTSRGNIEPSLSTCPLPRAADRASMPRIPSGTSSSSSTPTLNNVAGVTLLPPKEPDGLPEVLPDFSHTPNFYFCGFQICCTSGLLVPISCLRTPQSHRSSTGFVLQPDSIPYFWSPPPGLESATTGHINRGSGEHGPLQPPSDRVETIPDRRPLLFQKDTTRLGPPGLSSFLSASGSNLPPVSPPLTAQPLSSPEGPAHMTEGQIA